MVVFRSLPAGHAAKGGRRSPIKTKKAGAKGHGGIHAFSHRLTLRRTCRPCVGVPLVSSSVRCSVGRGVAKPAGAAFQQAFTCWGDARWSHDAESILRSLGDARKIMSLRRVCRLCGL